MSDNNTLNKLTGQLNGIAKELKAEGLLGEETGKDSFGEGFEGCEGGIPTKECRFCKEKIPEQYMFCYKCGGLADDTNYKSILGIDITPDDLMTYIIKGYISKKVPIGTIKASSGDVKMTITVRTLTQDQIMKIAIDTENALQASSTSTNNTYAEVYKSIKVRQILVAIGDKPIIEKQEIPANIANLALHRHQYMENMVLTMLQEGQFQNF